MAFAKAWRQWRFIGPLVAIADARFKGDFRRVFWVAVLPRSFRRSARPLCARASCFRGAAPSATTVHWRELRHVSSAFWLWLLLVLCLRWRGSAKRS